MAIPVTPIPGTFFEWEDKSGITTPEITTVASMPLFCVHFGQRRRGMAQIVWPGMV